MSFHERYRRLERLAGLAAVLHHHLLSVLALNGKVLVDLGIGRGPQHQTHNESDAHLAHNLVFALQAFLVALEDLDEVVHAAEQPQPHGGDDHQDEIDIAQTAQQQHGNQDGHDDDDTAHRWHANLLHAERIDLGVALGLGDLLALEVLDEVLTKPCRYGQTQDERQQCTEGDVAPHVGTADTILLQESEEII